MIVPTVLFPPTTQLAPFPLHTLHTTDLLLVPVTTAVISAVAPVSTVAELKLAETPAPRPI